MVKEVKDKELIECKGSSCTRAQHDEPGISKDSALNHSGQLGSR